MHLHTFVLFSNMQFIKIHTHNSNSKLKKAWSPIDSKAKRLMIHTHKNINTGSANQIKTKYPQDKTRPSTPNLNTKPGEHKQNTLTWVLYIKKYMNY
jgi:hypothetical protein